MGDQRDGGIAWTEATWNPIRGCSRVSEGCRNCYAETMAARFSGPGQPYEGLATRTPSGPRWTGKVRMIWERLGDPVRWMRPRMVFVNSMSDLFHEELDNRDIAAVFGVMANAQRHTFQVLTKRPHRMREWFRWAERRTAERGFLRYTSEFVPHGSMIYSPHDADLPLRIPYVQAAWPLPNVWLGVSVEDQATAVDRVPVLLDTPAAVRWVSYEPALGPIDFGPWLEPHGYPYPPPTRGMKFVDGLDWIVVGGESGPGARPFNLEWARRVIRDCEGPDVPVFVKQLGARPHDGWTCASREECTHPDCGGAIVPGIRDRKGGKMEEWPEDLRVREWPRGHRA